MRTYTNIKSILPLIPKAIREEEGNTQLLSYALEGYRLLNLPQALINRVTMLEIKNHKVTLPTNMKGISLVTYMKTKPDETSTNELEALYTDEETKEYYIAHRLFLHSQYFQQNFFPLKYIQTDYDYCQGCANLFCTNCTETFSVSHNRILTTSLKEGWLCIYYYTDNNSDGEFFILDNPDVKRYLSLYAQMENVRNRSYMHEENMYNILDRLEMKTNTWYNKARGSVMLSTVNMKLIEEMTVKNFNVQFFRELPEALRQNYFYYG